MGEGGDSGSGDRAAEPEEAAPWAPPGVAPKGDGLVRLALELGRLSLPPTPPSWNDRRTGERPGGVGVGGGEGGSACTRRDADKGGHALRDCGALGGGVDRVPMT
jgi:hypothetical protein